MSSASSVVDSGDLHPLARKVPAAKRTSDLVEKIRLDQERAAQVEIIHSIMSEPALAMPTLGFLHSQRSKKNKNGAHEHSFPDSYNTFARLPTYWMAAHIEAVTKNGLDRNFLEGCTKVDSFSVRAMFHYAHSTTDSDYWPREMLLKTTLAKQFTFRYYECGERLKNFKKFIKNDAVSWVAASPYILQYTEKTVVVIKHRFSEDAITLKAHQVITDGFVPADFYSEKLATLSLDGSSYTLANLFAPGTGPWKFILAPKSKYLVSLTQQALSNYRAPAPIREDATFGAAAAKEARKHSIDKARATAQSKKKQRKTLSLSDLLTS